MGCPQIFIHIFSHSNPRQRSRERQLEFNKQGKPIHHNHDLGRENEMQLRSRAVEYADINKINFVET